MQTYSTPAETCRNSRLRCERTTRGRRFRTQRGFSLIELLIVVSIAIVAAAMAMMTMNNAVRSVRLSEAGTEYANLLQKARIRAVQDDRFYTVRTAPGSAYAPATAFVDLQGTGAYATGDPRMAFPEGVTPMAFAQGPALANLESQFLPPGANSLITINTTQPGPTFGPRGLPCSPVAAGVSMSCPSTTPTSYISFFQNQENTQWEAVTVTPAGRIRQWSYDGTGTWLPRN